jgi:cyanophycinase-like exopeptidase
MPSFVLMGSGEFLPWAKDPDGWALETSSIDSDRVVVSPLAAAPEGREVFDEWAGKGVRHFEALGMRVDVLEVHGRPDADDAENAALIRGARYTFFSGGNPAHIARSLRGTATWRVILEALSAGMPLGGCSAGMVALGVTAPDIAAMDGRANEEGLKLFTKAYLQAHWDQLDSYVPGLTQRILDAWPPGSVLFALDEDTAACGDGAHWRVTGKGALTLPGLDGLERIPDGGHVGVDLGLSAL